MIIPEISHQVREHTPALDQLLVRPFFTYAPFAEAVDVVDTREEVQGVSDEDDGLATLFEVHDRVGEEFFSYVGVDSGEGVVQDDYFGVAVESPSQVDYEMNGSDEKYRISDQVRLTSSFLSSGKICMTR